MKKGVFIVAGILAVGGLTYLYFANKKKKDAVLSSGTSGASSTSGTATTGVGASSVNTEIPPLSTGGISPITNVESQQNLDKANDIAKKIREYYKLSASKDMLIKINDKSSFLKSFAKISNPYPSKIKKLKDDLLKLGYEFKGEKDGVLVKL